VTDRSTPAAFLGAWRIDTMELWAKDAIELLGPGTFIFDDEAFGEFRCIAVRGWMDCRFGDRNGRPLVEFSWQGKDERDDASGRGWAIIDETGTLGGESTSIRAMIRRSPRRAWQADRERRRERNPGFGSCDQLLSSDEFPDEFLKPSLPITSDRF
jgi:hypothetical protein